MYRIRDLRWDLIEKIRAAEKDLNSSEANLTKEQILLGYEEDEQQFLKNALDQHNGTLADGVQPVELDNQLKVDHIEKASKN